MPEGIIFYPGDTLPHSPPEISGERQGKGEGTAQRENQVAALRDYVDRNVKVFRLVARDFEEAQSNPDTDPSELRRFGWAVTHLSLRLYGLIEASRILEYGKFVAPKLLTDTWADFIAPYKDILNPQQPPDS